MSQPEGQLQAVRGRAGLLLGLTALGVVLRVVAAIRREPFVDELHALYVAHGGLGPFWIGLWETPGIGPLDYGLVKVLDALGAGLHPMRLLMCGLQLTGIWRLHRIVLKASGENAALLAAGLCLLSPLLIDQAASIRPYAGAFMVGVFALGWLLEAPGTMPQALGRGVLAALGVGYQFFLGPVALSAMALGMWRDRKQLNLGPALVQIALPLVVFAIVLPMILGAGDMRTGKDNVAGIITSLLGSLLAFSGWGLLPLGLVTLWAAIAGCRKLPPLALPWALLMALIILAGEQKSQVHVLARHYAPLTPLIAFAAALWFTSKLQAKPVVQTLLLAVMALSPVNLEAHHPGIWLWGLDLRSDFRRDLHLLAGETGPKKTLVALGSLDGLWRYVLQEEIKAYGLGHRLKVISPAQFPKEVEGSPLALSFAIPDYLDPSKAGLAALGFPPARTKQKNDFGGFGKLLALNVKAEEESLRLMAGSLDALKPFEQGEFKDLIRLSRLSQQASLDCRRGEAGERFEELSRFENTLRDNSDRFQRVLVVNWASAMATCLKDQDPSAHTVTRIMDIGARALGVPSNALTVQTGWSPRRYYRSLRDAASGFADDAPVKTRAVRALRRLGHMAEPPLWP